MRNIRATRGNTLQCRGWIQEAALRAHNNLDPDVAETQQTSRLRTGKAARNCCFDQIVATLKHSRH